MKKIVLSYFFIFSIIRIYAQSPYEESISIPPYDANNPDMFLITSDSDWSHINDPSIHYFYVAPGDYSNAGLQENDYCILLNSSGSATQKRYISLYNGNNLHPGKLDRSQLAKVGFVFQDANYWVIDRMAYWERYDGRIPVTFYNSDYNILNRYFAENVAGGMVYIFSFSDDNVIQNCSVRRNDINIYIDRAAIALNGDHNEPVINNKIINNEVYNFVDGFQAVAVKYSGHDFYDYQGTIVDNNIFYIDNTIYTDCNGNPDPNGNCAYAENGIDLKSGSENPNNPFIVTNNKMWGFRQADETNSYLDDVGSAIVPHYNVNNTIISNNLIFDSQRGITVGGPINGSAWRNSEFSDNIIYQTKGIAIKIYDSNDIIFENNLLKDVSLDAVWKNTAFLNCNNITVQNDLRVDTHDTSGIRIENSTVTPSNNGYYNSLPGDLQDATDIIYSQDPTDSYSDYVFTTDNFTNSPRTITLPKLLNGTTGFENNKMDKVLIYPTLVSDKLFVLIDNTFKSEIFIFDIYGQLIYNSELHKKTNAIDLSKINKGIYLVKIKAGSQQKNFKIIKK